MRMKQEDGKGNTQQKNESGKNIGRDHTGRDKILGDSITINVHLDGKEEMIDLPNLFSVIENGNRANIIQNITNGKIKEGLSRILNQGSLTPERKREITELLQREGASATKGYRDDPQSLWYLLDRVALKNKFDLLINQPPPSNLRILLFPEEESALSRELPQILNTWWKDRPLPLETKQSFTSNLWSKVKGLWGRAEEQNIGLNPTRIEMIDFSKLSSKEVEQLWLMSMYHTLSQKSSISQGVNGEQSIEHLNQQLTDIGGQTMRFMYQRLSNVFNRKGALQEYIEKWRALKWPLPTVLLLLITPYDSTNSNVVENAGACFHCVPEDYYTKVNSVDLDEFYELCKERKDNVPYDTNHRFIEPNNPIPFKQAVEQLRFVG